ncbi:hypothetical protein N7541_003533 [Penicillium brevicompactum]|uniref:Uncharacterized protein n=1 Tax=Penicillium brevicompactum TaxID=5074 RepID=A0A9W9RPJ5_PENBR|nr:hypothetical protein N7541_003533 [Penicillium brevicompactum]
MSEPIHPNMALLLDAGIVFRARTQADGMPKYDSNRMQLLRVQLKTPLYFDEWCKDVSRVLKHWRLDALINKDILRPDENSPEFVNWEEASKGIFKWLCDNMDAQLVDFVQNGYGRSVYADEFMARVKLCFYDYDHRCDMNEMIRALSRVTHCKRHTFDDAESFIRELINRFWHTKLYKLEMPAFLPLSILFEQLKHEMPEIIARMVQKVYNMPYPAQYLTSDDFLEVCYDIQDYIESPDDDENSELATANSGNEDNHSEVGDDEDEDEDEDDDDEDDDDDDEDDDEEDDDEEDDDEEEESDPDYVGGNEPDDIVDSGSESEDLEQEAQDLMDLSS